MAWHPEWWMLAISGVAWCSLLAPGSGAACTCGMAWPAGTFPGSEEWGRALGDWLVMVLAMMLPLMVIPARTTAFGSLWCRRHWAIGTFLAGYIAIWMAAGVLSLVLIAIVRSVLGPGAAWAAGAGYLAAAAWQTTPWKRRLAVACHRTMPLAPAGWPAHRDCLRFGADHGIYCVGNCGLLMLVSMLSPWYLTMMIVTALLLLYERYQARPGDRFIPWVLGAVAVEHCLA
jgi:predicted metal-binding membrane protein